MPDFRGRDKIQFPSYDKSNVYLRRHKYPNVSKVGYNDIILSLKEIKNTAKCNL